MEMGFLKGVNMGNEFLYKEYELNYEQLRFYDSRQESIFLYLFTLTSSVAAAQFAIYKLFSGATQGFYKCHLFLSLIVFIATVLLYLSMLQNRLYFVFTARQLNAIRKHLLENETPKFKDNQLYTSTNFPAIKLSSIHTMQLIGAVFISSLFASSVVYALLSSMNQEVNLGCPIFSFVIIAVFEIISGFIYLDTHGKKSADEAVHRR